MGRLTVADKDFVIVVWDDADSTGVEVITDENIDSYHKPAVMKTAGWLLKDDDRGVSIANEVYQEDGKERWRGHTFVPRSLVRSVTPVGFSRKRKPRKKVEEGQ